MHCPIMLWNHPLVHDQQAGHEPATQLDKAIPEKANGHVADPVSEPRIGRP
jgi:hypothetical protein